MATDTSGQLMMMTPTYNNDDSYGYGPLDATTGAPLPDNQCSTFNNVWKASRWAIERLNC